MADVEEGAYEAMRAANVKRNAEIMRALGLDLSDFTLHKAHKASAGADKGGKPAKSTPAPRKRKASETSEQGADGQSSLPASTRKSSRIRGVAAEVAGADGPEDEVPQTELMCASDEQHDAAERDHLRWAGRQGTATIVGTASYKHTLHRVMTMSPAALGRRVEAIERACGKVSPRTYSHADMMAWGANPVLRGWCC
jgi:hypothetical protein